MSMQDTLLRDILVVQVLTGRSRRLIVSLRLPFNIIDAIVEHCSITNRKGGF